MQNWTKKLIPQILFFLISFQVISYSPYVALASQLDTEVSRPTESEIQQARENSPLKYSQLVRELNQKAKSNDPKEKELVQEKLNQFIAEEEAKLESKDLANDKKEKYLENLQLQKVLIDPKLEKAEQIRESILGLKPDKDKTPRSPLEVDFVEHPPSFNRAPPTPEIKSLKKPQVRLSSYQNLDPELKDFVFIQPAYALDDNQLPTIEDLASDQNEVFFNAEIEKLASELGYSPVQILNYVQNNIDYSPYYGAEKGSIGCLQSKVCNDVDTASLTIALMRASGIPARYQNGLALFSVEQLKELLAVDETRTVYFAFAGSGIPIYSLTGAIDDQTNVDQADFSNEQYFAVEWTSVEIFHQYDQKGGNVTGDKTLRAIDNNQDLAIALNGENKRQWLELDPSFKKYQQSGEEIVPQTENIDVENFWNQYLSYQGNETPIENFISEVYAQTNKDLNQEQYQNSRELYFSEQDILPPSLPYALASAADGSLDIESWSALPDEKRSKVIFTITKDEDDSEIFSHQFFATAVNNQGLRLYYDGVTEQDNDTIDSYGGIESTPPSLVSVRPIVQTDPLGLVDSQMAIASLEGQSLQIGDKLILQFEYFTGGQSAYLDQKFSIAGNSEGIFISLGPVYPAPIDYENPDDRDALVLNMGTWSVAREYIKTITEKGQQLQKVFGRQYNNRFARAVVSQTRDLNRLSNGDATSFDFTGMQIDAGSSINSYSYKGNYNQNAKDFNLLWGQEASYQEAEIFAKLTPLDTISTVRGLQLAAANPGEYTIHTIDSSNANVIDTLQFSANTKSYMQSAVQDGRTIITPQKPITMGQFAGILYIAIDPDTAEANYAIGEQVANGGYATGGYSVGQITVYEYCGYSCRAYWHSSDALSDFVYSPFLRRTEGELCTIDAITFANVVGHTDDGSGTIPAYESWFPDYGAPCLKLTRNYNGTFHTFVLATNAAKFYSSARGYNYWVPRSIFTGKVEVDFPNHEDYTYTFNPRAGVYYGYSSDGSAIYYSPQPPGLDENNYNIWYDHGSTLPADGSVYKRLNDKIIGLGGSLIPSIQYLGYPISERLEVGEDGYGQEGIYQDFVGGRVYIEEDVAFDDRYVSPTKIANFVGTPHESPARENYGFPKDDPVTTTNSNGQKVVRQHFTNDTVVEWNTETDAVNVTEYLKYDCKLYDLNSLADSFKYLIFLHGILDGGIDVLEDTGQMIKDIYDYISSADIESVIQDISDIISGIKAVVLNLDYLLDYILENGTDILKGYVDQIKEALSESCYSRYYYLSGIAFAGVFSTVLAPSKKMKIATVLVRFKRFVKLRRGLSNGFNLKNIPGLDFENARTISKNGWEVNLTNPDDIAQWEVIKAAAQGDKDRLSKEFMNRFFIGESKAFSTGEGTRVSDLYNQKYQLNMELKNYSSSNVPCNDSDCSQVIKDELLVDIGDLGEGLRPQPIWFFIDRGPQPKLQNALNKAMIPYVILKSN